MARPRMMMLNRIVGEQKVNLTKILDPKSKVKYDSSFSCEVSIHDRRQLEFSFDLPFEKGLKDKNLAYVVEAYFFIPQSMGIGPGNYSGEDFYQNILNYQRVSTRGEVDLEQNDGFELEFLKQFLSGNFKQENFQVLLNNINQQVKNFAYEIDSSLRKTLEDLADTAGIINGENSFPLLLKLKHITKRLNNFRKLYVDKMANAPFEHPVREILYLVDEFLSNRYEAIIGQIAEQGTSEDLAPAFYSQVDEFLASEVSYQMGSDFVSLTKANSDSAKEEFFHRQGQLKKYVYDVLYLDRHNHKKEKFYQNLVAMIGASLAALWATMAEIQRIRILRQQDTSLNYIPLILIAVIAYVFKDRIKDITKEVLHRYLSKIMPDFKSGLIFTAFLKSGKKTSFRLGEMHENISTPDREHLPKPVAQLRDNTHSTVAYRPPRRENVYSYRKITYSRPWVLEKCPICLNSLKDIWRIDIGDFLSRLDDPKKNMVFFDVNSGAETTKVQKVYHLNIVFGLQKLNSKNPKKSPDLMQWHKVRLVLNKKGIVRLDAFQ